MRRIELILLMTVLAMQAVPGNGATQEAADMILTGGKVWTGNVEAPAAEAIAVKDNRILAVGSVDEINNLSDSETVVMDLPGHFIMPGFIDNHTHFDRAGALLLGVNLLDVNSREALVREVKAAAERMPEGAWLRGGDWGAYAQWRKNSTGEAGDGPAESFDPDRSLIDPVTPENPALLSKWDGSVFLANTLALERAGADCSWHGVECEKGSMTGRISPEAAERIRAIIPEKSMEQRLAEARIALKRLRKHGVTTIHDITGARQLGVFRELKERDELTVRVYARPTLDKWDELAAVGIKHGFGDPMLKIGGLKGFVDGIMGNSSARFYEPYLTTGERGRWRDMMYPPGNMKKLLVGADSAGHWPQVHAIGDQAIDSLLNLYEYVIDHNAPRERRFRVIHTQVLSGPDAARRMAEMGIIAEVQPYHAIDDMRWMEERIGERSRWAYAFRTLKDSGVLLSFGSDWPGTNASWYTSDPIMGIYAAVARQT
ncbi:MAG: amidohydrolase, partial [Balneolaceae bacterium]|nr:amidohydrolase [Balneolaceae bacterium]